MKKIISGIILVGGGILLFLMICYDVFWKPIKDFFTKNPFDTEHILAILISYAIMFGVCYAVWRIVSWAINNITKD
jgi:hypothetical protein